MRGNGRWVAVIVASLAAIVVVGVIASQVQLDRAVEERCGTTLRPNPTDVILLRQSADLVEQGFDGPVTPETAAAAAGQRERAADLESRCKSRRRVALVGLGTVLAVAGAAVAWSTYQLGYRAGVTKGAAGPASEPADREKASLGVG